MTRSSVDVLCETRRMDLLFKPSRVIALLWIVGPILVGGAWVLNRMFDIGPIVFYGAAVIWGFRACEPLLINPRAVLARVWINAGLLIIVEANPRPGKPPNRAIPLTDIVKVEPIGFGVFVSMKDGTGDVATCGLRASEVATRLRKAIEAETIFQNGGAA